jgi:hypothetical protein
MMATSSNRLSYRVLLIVSFVALSLVSASVTGLYLYRLIVADAQTELVRGLGSQAAAFANDITQATQLEHTRASILAKDSDMVLATRSILFEADARQRLKQFLEDSRWSHMAALATKDGRLLIETSPQAKSTKMALDKAWLQARLAKPVSVEGKPWQLEVLEEPKAKGNTPQRKAALLVPIDSLTQITGHLVLVTDLDHLPTLVHVDPTASANLQLRFAPEPFGTQSQPKPKVADGLLVAQADVLLPLSTGHLGVVVTQDTTSRWAKEQNRLRSILGGLGLLVALLGAAAYGLSGVFLRPLKKLALFVGSSELAPAATMPRLFAELQTIAQEVQRQRIVIHDQFDMLGHTISTLEQANRSLQDLSLDMRHIASAMDHAALVQTLSQALGRLGPKRLEACYVRSESETETESNGTLQKIFAAQPELWPDAANDAWLGEQSPRQPTILRDRDGQVTLAFFTQQPMATADLADDENNLVNALCLSASLTLDNLNFVNRVRLEERLRGQLDNARIEAELIHLKNQLNPHFLFNALNSVAHLVEVNPNEAVAALSKLAQLYRHIIRASGENMIPLSQELDLVSRYLEIEKMRFTHRLEAEVVCTITDTSIRVPSLLIQTLVDNGIKHGIARSAAGGVVTVHVALSAADPDHLTIEVSNTGAPLAPTRPQGPLSSGTGLANIEKRLRLLYGEDGSCTLESQPDGVTVARVVVPLGGQA